MIYSLTNLRQFFFIWVHHSSINWIPVSTIIYVKFNVFLFYIFVNSTENTLVYTVASESTDGYERYANFAKQNGIEFKALGLNEKWRGGDMNSAGGGYKVNLLKKAIKDYKDDKDRIVLFTDR